MGGGAWRGEILGHLAAWEEKQQEGFSVDLASPAFPLPSRPSATCFCLPESLLVVNWQLIALRLEVIRAKEERNERGKQELAALLSTSRASCLMEEQPVVDKLALHLGCGPALGQEVDSLWREVEALVREEEQAIGGGRGPGDREVGVILDMLPSYITARLERITGWGSRMPL